MSSKTTTIQIRVDEDLKKKAVKILSGMHISMSGAIKMFLGQVANQGRIPLEYLEFNEETKKVMDEVDAGIGLNEVNSVEELFEELDR
ncbi:MAG: type II toxin-antitoxin system RelB/DinJ family antitoxin [Planctomycetes bacterium]|nr:type II toxin-antitoxin system RelB/DinJ family antitoxin [Planctomycetota bacterium]